MWVYEQSTGALRRRGKLVATGYSGAGEGKNAPDKQNVPKVGPLPEGAYWIQEPRDTPTHGPFVLPLLPVTPGTEMFGRSGFLIHGDSKTAPGTASQGCIIVGFDARKRIWDSGDRLLAVIY